MNDSQRIRASDQERNQAIDALAEHARTNRLSIADFDERVEAVSAAEVRGEIDALFDDLPEPRPHFDVAAPEVTSASEVAAQRPGNSPMGRGRGAIRAVSYGLFMSSGVVAIVLAVVTGSWLWFFILPPAFYLIRQWAKRL